MRWRTFRRISSGTFRTWSFTPRAPECEKITGADETLSELADADADADADTDADADADT